MCAVEQTGMLSLSLRVYVRVLIPDQSDKSRQDAHSLSAIHVPTSEFMT